MFICSLRLTLRTELQGELKVKDDEYVKNLRAAASDIDLALQYMEEQVCCVSIHPTFTRRAQVQALTAEYRRQLEEIETTFMLERAELLTAMKKARIRVIYQPVYIDSL